MKEIWEKVDKPACEHDSTCIIDLKVSELIGAACNYT